MYHVAVFSAGGIYQNIVALGPGEVNSCGILAEHVLAEDNVAGSAVALVLYLRLEFLSWCLC